MNFLLDPNVGYVLLLGGVALALLALFIPGSGVLELGAFFALFLAGYIMVNLPVNAWAIGLLLIALIPLTLAVRWRKGGLLLLVGSIGLMVLGSLFVFADPKGGPAVHPFVAILVSAGLAWLFWFLARKSLEASRLRPSHDLEKLIGQSGVVRTDLRPEGSVYVGGENWSARSRDYIPTGSLVRVLQRDGLFLLVEKIPTEE